MADPLDPDEVFPSTDTVPIEVRLRAKLRYFRARLDERDVERLKFLDHIADLQGRLSAILEFVNGSR